MSNIGFLTILFLLTKVKSISRQSFYGDFPSNFSLQNLREIQTVGFDVLNIRNNSTNLSSNGRFAHASMVGSDRTLKSTKLNLLNVKTTNFFTKSLNICEQKLLSGFKGDGKSTLILPWYYEVFKGIYYLLKRCQSEVGCYQKQIIRGMDRMIKMKSVKLADGIFLVKDHEDEVSTMPRDSEKELFMIAVSRRIIQVLETHALRVRVGAMKDDVAQARIGHHGYKHAFPMMVGSFMLLASFMVPMGFQFLAVVGGKALVLSQIALVMAMGSTLQRFFGFGNQKQGNVGGIVQHDYYMRDDLQPWQRQGSEDKHQQITYPHRHVTDHSQHLTMTHRQLLDHQQLPDHQHLTHQQLQGLMNYHQQ